MSPLLCFFSINTTTEPTDDGPLETLKSHSRSHHSSGSTSLHLTQCPVFWLTQPSCIHRSQSGHYLSLNLDGRITVEEDSILSRKGYDVPERATVSPKCRTRTRSLGRGTRMTEDRIGSGSTTKEIPQRWTKSGPKCMNRERERHREKFLVISAFQSLWGLLEDTWRKTGLLSPTHCCPRTLRVKGKVRWRMTCPQFQCRGTTGNHDWGKGQQTFPSLIYPYYCLDE